MIAVLLIAVTTGFTGAVLWANSDSDYIRQRGPVAPPPDRRAADEALAEIEPTTTTKPDLSPEALADKLRPSVWAVSTLDSSGAPAEGTAFVAGSAGNRGLLVTSLSVVEASTREPGPEITVKGATFSGTATLWTWDEGRDLALLVVDRGSAPAPPWAGDAPPLRAGDRIFAVGGGGQVSPGRVVAISPTSIDHDVVVDDRLRGGPLVNVKGEVVAIASAAFADGRQLTETVYFGVPIHAACGGVLNCGGANAPSTTAPERPTTTRRTSRTTTPS